MRWRKWKMGLLVSALTGALTGVVGLAVGVTGRQAWMLVAVSAAKDILLYLKAHPVEDVGDTQFLTKGQV